MLAGHINNEFVFKRRSRMVYEEIDYVFDYIQKLKKFLKPKI